MCTGGSHGECIVVPCGQPREMTFGHGLHSHGDVISLLQRLLSDLPSILANAGAHGVVGIGALARLRRQCPQVRTRAHRAWPAASERLVDRQTSDIPYCNRLRGKCIVLCCTLSGRPEDDPTPIAAVALDPGSCAYWIPVQCTSAILVRAILHVCEHLHASSSRTRSAMRALDPIPGT